MKKVLLWFFALTFVLQCTLSVSAEDYELSDWAREEITMPLEEFGIDNFKDPVTRKSFCEIVLKVLDAQGITLECSEPYEEHPFSDTDDENVIRLYNVKFIAYHSEKRVVQGKGDNTFAPDEYITRKDAAWILFRI